jgi:2-keto-4-pentenoate hydratase/2-oxohepta-3-ene-1,7-dioic acid hydratase in catechol pathway
MKFCRFNHDGSVGFGYVVGDKIHVCQGDMMRAPHATGAVLGLADVQLLPPVLPGKIIGIGRNYAEHARELGNEPPLTEPLIFLKAPSSILPPYGTIIRPEVSQRVDHEGELGVVIGRTARNLAENDDPLACVFGYCCVNDVTARDLQKKDVQFTRAKGFDTFCPFGPWIETELDPSGLTVETRVNGQLRQKGNTRDMIFGVADLVRYVAGIMTLFPGDLIATGTPAGVGPLLSGDTVEIEVEGIGVLVNSVR